MSETIFGAINEWFNRFMTHLNDFVKCINDLFNNQINEINSVS